MPGYPIELDLSGKLVLVVGLGMVGRRKAEALVAADARVIAVDPYEGTLAPPAGVELRREPYCARHLEGVRLVVASATPEVNRTVVADAKAAGIWVGSASEPDVGDFRIPAVWRNGPITLTVSTSGASPAFAAALRDRAGQALGPAAADFATLLAEMRPLVIARVHDPEKRRQLLMEFADTSWLDLWNVEGADVVRRRLWERLEFFEASSR